MSRISVVALAAIGVAGLFSTPSNAAWYLALGETQIENAPFGPNSEGITIRFENDGAGAVKVTIKNQTSSLPGVANVHIHRIVFNIKDLFFGSSATDALFSIAHDSGEQAGSVEIERDRKQIDVTNEKYFDIGLNFGGGQVHGFISNETSVYRITSSVAGFDEHSFKALNWADGPPDFYAGVHYGYTGPVGSGSSGGETIEGPDGEFEPVPLPTSSIVLLLAGLSLFVFRSSIGLVA